MLYSELKPRVDNALQDVASGQDRYAASQNQVSGIVSKLTAMPSTYAEVIAAVNGGATANPTDPAWTALKAAKDLAVSDRTTVLDRAEAIVMAYAAIAEHGASAVTAKLAELEA